MYKLFAYLFYISLIAVVGTAITTFILKKSTKKYLWISLGVLVFSFFISQFFDEPADSIKDIIKITSKKSDTGGFDTDEKGNYVLKGKALRNTTVTIKDDLDDNYPVKTKKLRKNQNFKYKFHVTPKEGSLDINLHATDGKRSFKRDLDFYNNTDTDDGETVNAPYYNTTEGHVLLSSDVDKLNDDQENNFYEFARAIVQKENPKIKMSNLKNSTLYVEKLKKKKSYKLIYECIDKKTKKSFKSSMTLIPDDKEISGDATFEYKDYSSDLSEYKQTNGGLVLKTAESSSVTSQTENSSSATEQKAPADNTTKLRKISKNIKSDTFSGANIQNSVLTFIIKDDEAYTGIGGFKLEQKQLLREIEQTIQKYRDNPLASNGMIFTGARYELDDGAKSPAITFYFDSAALSSMPDFGMKSADYSKEYDDPTRLLDYATNHYIDGMFLKNVIKSKGIYEGKGLIKNGDETPDWLIDVETGDTLPKPLK
ncbi:hypothetical protein ACPBEH_11120 [Latilactobacillus sp. 5-91]|uniref:hypothetical protein n=1 Tax=Latilactobacillus sp. 5-91 TaxID=3410924 RepID=UPI003C713855